MISLLNLYSQPQDPIAAEGLPTELQVAFFGPAMVLPNETTGVGGDDWLEAEYQTAFFGPDRKPDKFGAAAFYPDHVLGAPGLPVDQQIAFFSLGLPIPNASTGQGDDMWLETEQQIAWFGPLFQPSATPFPWTTPIDMRGTYYAPPSVPVGPELPIPKPVPPPPPPPGPGPGGGFGGSTWSSATLFPERLEEEFWLRNADRVKKMREAWANMPDLIDEDRDVFEKTAVGDAEETAATAGAKGKKEEEPKLTEEQWRLRAKLRELLNPSAKAQTAPEDEVDAAEHKAEAEPSIPISAIPALLLELNRTQLQRVAKPKPATIFGFSIPTVLFVGVAAAAAWWYFNQEPMAPEPEPYVEKPRKKKKKRKYVEEE